MALRRREGIELPQQTTSFFTRVMIKTNSTPFPAEAIESGIPTLVPYVRERPRIVDCGQVALRHEDGWQCPTRWRPRAATGAIGLDQAVREGIGLRGARWLLEVVTLPSGRTLP